jgi:hypothetical protein
VRQATKVRFQRRGCAVSPNDSFSKQLTFAEWAAEHSAEFATARRPYTWAEVVALASYATARRTWYKDSITDCGGSRIWRSTRRSTAGRADAVRGR